MYLRSKKIAFLGLLTALSVIFLILSGVIEVSTFFFLVAAAVCVGIAICESSIGGGIAMYVATVLLGILLAPNKMYCFTYSALSLYIIAIEATIRFIEKRIHDDNKEKRLLFPIKYIYFNIIYLPIVFLLPKLIYPGEFSTKIYLVVIFGGQIGFYIFDWAYFNLIDYYCRRFRKN